MMMGKTATATRWTWPKDYNNWDYDINDDIDDNDDNYNNDHKNNNDDENKNT